MSGGSKNSAQLKAGLRSYKKGQELLDDMPVSFGGTLNNPRFLG